MKPSLKRRLSQTATITQQPRAGQTGQTAISSDVPCTAVYPAGKDQWDLGTTIGLHEVLIQSASGVLKGHVVTIGSDSYIVEQVKSWEDVDHLLLRKRGA